MFDRSFVAASAKQQASYLKKHLGLALHEAQKHIATSNQFADWHEYTTVLDRNPADPRLGALAVSRRAGHAVMTNANVAKALQNRDRLATAIGAGGQDHWLRSRGFNSKDEVVSLTHLGGSGIPLDQLLLRGQAEAFPYQLNLWDIPGRLLFICGSAGAGKTTLAAFILQEHVEHHGHATYITPYGPLRSPKSELPSRIITAVEASSDRLRWVGLPDRDEPYAWEQVVDDLPPCSLVVIDDWSWVQRRLYGGLQAAIAAVDTMTSRGHVVVVLTQEFVWDAWPEPSNGLYEPLPPTARVITGHANDYNADPESFLASALRTVRNSFHPGTFIDLGVTPGLLRQAKTIDELLVDAAQATLYGFTTPDLSITPVRVFNGLPGLGMARTSIEPADFATAPRSPYRVHVISASGREPAFDEVLDVLVPDHMDHHEARGEIEVPVSRELYKKGHREAFDPATWKILNYEPQL